jgi:hypothetical protein
VSADYNAMSRAEIERELKRLISDLEDLEETMAFHFTNTAAHIPGSSVARSEEESQTLKAQIARLEKLLSEM